VQALPRQWPYCRSDRIVKERPIIGGRVRVAGGVANERPNTGGRVAAAGGVITHSECSRGRIATADGVAKQGVYSVGCVVVCRRVVIECINTVGRIVDTSRVQRQRINADGRVDVPSTSGKSATQMSESTMKMNDIRVFITLESRTSQQRVEIKISNPKSLRWRQTIVKKRDAYQLASSRGRGTHLRWY
jgi:hypothetical protein